MKTFEYRFNDIVKEKDGFLRGPFGSALKKSIFVPKSNDTYKVYEQGVVLQKNKNIGKYYISNEYFKNSLSRFEVKSGDFLVSCSGVNYGAIYQLKGNIEQGVINQALLRIRLNNNIVDDDFFYYYFQSYIVKVITTGTGDSTIPNFPSMDFIKKIPLKLPSLDDQKKIGKTISILEEKILLNTTINSKLESMAKRLYDYWFVQFDFPGADGKPYKSNGGKMVWNEELKREIPEGWEVSRLGEVVELLKDGTHNPPKRQNEGIPLLTGTMFGENFLDYSKATYISQQDYENIHSQYKPKENDVIITKIGTLGNVNLLRNIDIPIAIHCNSALLRFNKILGTYFPFYYCKSDLFKMRLKAVKGQSIQEFASLDSISSIWSEIPLEEVIKKFECMIKPILEKQISISLENKKLSEMRDTLLPLLMNGQVVVE